MPNFTFRFPWRRTREIEREVAEELWIHLQQRIEELVDAGMPLAEARRTAEESFGDLRGTTAYCVAQGRGAERIRERQRWWADMVRDLQQGVRGMRQRPAFTALAVITLALGIGGTTATASIVHRLLVRPFDVPHGDRIVLLHEGQAGSRVSLFPAASTVAAWRDGSTESFEALESAERRDLTVGSGDGAPAEQVQGLRASPGLASLIGVAPAAGRWFAPEEFGPTPARVVVLSDALWRRRFGGSADILGRPVSLQGETHLVIGILPPGAEQLPVRALRADLWRPGADWSVTEGRPGLNVFGLLRPGVSLTQATAQLEAVSAELAQTNPRFSSWKGAVTAVTDQVGRSTRRGLLVLLSASGLLLLLGCANVAQMLLARGLERRQEFAVRAALGAGRGRLVRQAMTEHVGLGLLGGAAGALLAYALVSLGVRVMPPELGMLEGFRPGGEVLATAILLGLVTVLGFGLYPALEAALRASRGAGGRLVPASRGAAATRGRNVLLASQVAIAATILVGAALLTRAMVRLTTQDVGFDLAGLVTWSARIPEWRYPAGDARQLLLEQITARVARVPGVTRVARASNVPPNAGVSFGQLELGDRTLSEAEQVTFFPTLWVEPEFFATMGSRLVSGRYLEAGSESEAERFVVVNQAMAERFWPASQAVGQRFKVGEGEDWSTIVGVVADVPAIGLTEMENQPQLYFLAHRDWASNEFVARTTGDPAGVLRAVTAAIHEIDPEIVVNGANLIQDQLGETVAGPRFFHLLLAGFALTALAIAAAGLVGIVRHTVTQRAREMAVRLALGAVPAALQRRVVRQAIVPVLGGLGSGIVASWWGSRFLAAQLYGVSPHDTLAFGGAATVLVLVALVAAWFPAGRVSRIAPMTTLRAD